MWRAGSRQSVDAGRGMRKGQTVRAVRARARDRYRHRAQCSVERRRIRGTYDAGIRVQHRHHAREAAVGIQAAARRGGSLLLRIAGRLL